jgi:hypothetical protein
MYSLIELKTLVSSGRDPARSLPLRRGFLLIPLVFACFAFLPQTQAVLPPEIVPNDAIDADGCYPSFVTAEGCGVLAGPGIGGLGSTAIGWRALFFSGASFWNTGVGAGALAINTGDENTAVGAGALLINLGVDHNTAIGAFTLFQNQLGFNNTAVGAEALFFNDVTTLGTANNNTAVGWEAMEENVNAARNTAVGSFALQENDFFGNNFAADNTAVGFGALRNNIDGGLNSAVGSDALVFNTLGALNNAFGFAALAFNDSAVANTAMGVGALEFNDASLAGLANANTAVGFAAMINNVDGAENVVVGTQAGPNLVGPFPLGFRNTYVGPNVGTFDPLLNPLPDENTTIRIADFSEDGFGSSACYIGGIFNNFQAVNGVNIVQVTLDLNDDHLGWDFGPNQSGSVPSIPTRSAPVPRGKPQAPPSPQHQAKMKDRVEELEATVAQQQEQIATLQSAAVRASVAGRTVAQQQKQIETLTAQLKEQAAQIQRVSAQVEMIKPAPRVVENR